MTAEPLRVTIWNENIHETTQDEIRAVYPDGMHGALTEGLGPLLPPGTGLRTATLDAPEHGLPEEVVDSTDVLLWWGHAAHDRVSDQIVERVQRAVLSGMGLIVLHSGHFSKIFRTLMGTTCSLQWRDDGDRELLWSVAPGHPIADGVDVPLVLDEHETYGEFFDVPPPDELIFVSNFSGGEVFRSGLTYRRGRGRIFYFSPGEQKYPIYRHPGVLRVIANAILWARPVGERILPDVVHARRGSWTPEG